jgi:flagellar motor protein MotB
MPLKIVPLRLCVSAPLRLINPQSLSLTLSIAIFLAATSLVHAEPDKPKSLDAQLLDDLDAELLKDLPGPSKQPSENQKPGEPAGEDLGQPSEATNPLALIGERMRSVEKRMAAQDTSKETQQIQQQISDDLAALIEQAKKQCAACKQGGGSSGQAQAGAGTGDATAGPARDSSNRIEPGRKEEVETVKVDDVLRRYWGHLPDKLREQMQSSLKEQFLPKYERVIEDYYKRLAEDLSNKP